MAAGLGFKNFVSGEVLTAADVNAYLNSQTVMVFADAAARTAAIASPQEGMFSYLKDTNATQYYTGSAWTNLDTTGMVNPMTTTGDTIYSSSGTTPARLGIGSTGQVLTVAGGIPSWATPATTTFVGCSLKNSVAISLSNATDVTLTFDEENYDTDSMHSTSSNTSRITIPSGQGGYYAFRWGAVFGNNSSGNRRMRLTKNGVNIQNSALTTKGDGLTAISASTVISAVAGDYFELTALQDSGGALDIGISNILFYEANKVG